MNEFIARNGIIAQNNSTVSGSLTVTAGITGSIFGSASYATTAATASYANNFTVAGTLTAQTLVVQTITSSIVYSSGSNIFGNSLANTQTFTGSMYQTGSVAVFMGSVGINETNPLAMLHFSKQTTWGTSENRIININNTGTGGDINVPHNMGSITWYSGNSTPTAEIAAYRNTPASGNNIELRFITAESGTQYERIRITNTGNVGIGTTSPSYKLDVSGSGRFTGGLSLTSENPQLTFTDTTAGEDDMVLSMNGDYLEFLSNALRNIITVHGETSTYTGNVGIGTNTPSAKLHVSGGNAILKNAFIGEVSGYGAGNTQFSHISRNGAGEYSFLSADDGTTYVNSKTGTNIYFRVNNSDKVTINSSGDVLVGTTTSTYSTAGRGVVQVNGSSTAIFGLTVGGVDTGYLYHGGTDMSLWNTISGNIQIGTGNVERVRITSAGYVGIGTTNTTQYSGLYPAQLVVNAGSAVDGIFSTTNDSSAAELVLFKKNPTNGFGSLLIQHSGSSGRAIELNYGVNMSTGVGGTTSYFVNTNGSGYYAGNLGIGTTNPNNTLQVVGGVTATSFTGSFSGSLIAPGSTTQILYNNAGTIAGDSGLIYSGSRVGIGATSPSSRLDIQITNDNAVRLVGGGGTTAGNMILSKINNYSDADPINLFWADHGSPARTNNLVRIHSNETSAGGLPLRVTAQGTLASPTYEALAVNYLGNVGIGTTSPLNLLHVSQPSANTIFRLGNNASYDQFIYFNGGNDWSLGMDYSNSNAFVLSNASSIGTNDRLVVTSAGNVGIGTTSPSSILNTSGSNQGITHDDVAGKGYIRFRNSGTTLALFGVAGSWEGSTLQDTMIASETGLNIRFYTNGSATPKMFISGSGNVGIGITNPGFKLTVSGDNGDWATKITSGTAAAYFAYNAGYGASIDAGTSASSGTYILELVSNSTSRVFVRGDGNVGIGITTPGAKLVVGTQSSGDSSGDNSAIARVGASSVAGRVYGLTIANTATSTVGNDASLSFIVAGNYSATGVISAILKDTSSAYTDMAFSLYGGSGNVERMRILGINGNVGIGITNPNAKLQIAGTTGNLLTVGTLTNDWVGDVAIGIQNGNGVILSKINAANDSNRVLVFLRDDTNGASIVGYTPTGGSTNVGFNIRANATSYFNGGNVGIGITNPSNLLNTFIANGAGAFSKGIRISTGDGSFTAGHGGMLEFQNEDVMTAGIRGVRQSGWGSSLAFYVHNTSSGNTFDSTFVERMRINEAGDVLVGTTTSTWGTSNRGVLQVNGASQALVGLSVGDVGKGYLFHTGTNLYIDNTANGPTYFGTNGSTRMTITAAGNVGINTTSPGYKLEVQGNSYFGDTIYNGGGYISWTSGYGDGTTQTYNGNSLVFLTNSSSYTARMFISSSGNIGIGTTTPTQGKLVVNGGVYATSFTGSLLGNAATATTATNVVGGANRVLFNNATDTTTTDANLTWNGVTFNIGGTLTATVKSFIIDHPTKADKKLQYGVLEGPEHSVYVRGKLKNTNYIPLPDYWHALVHEDSITVNITAIGRNQEIWVNEVTDRGIYLGYEGDTIEYFYTVFAERKDIDKLVTEFDKEI